MKTVGCRNKRLGKVLIVLVIEFCVVGCFSSSPPLLLTNPQGAQRTYTSDFPLAENPVSEKGMWVNGGSRGFDWGNVQTASGLAFGTQPGTIQYHDSTALLTGAWAANQAAQATVHSINQDDSVFEEVELRLRGSISAHRITGYEILFRCSKTTNSYAAIVKWNGVVGDFTELVSGKGSRYGVANGDVVRATIIGNVITAYINGVQVLQARDNTYSGGNPGMGFDFWLNRNPWSGSLNDFGFTSYTATGGFRSLER